MVDKDASDLLLLAGNEPRMRIDGELQALNNDGALSSQDLSDLVGAVLSEEQKKRWHTEKEVDFALSLENIARFRVNLYYQKGAPAAALRRIPYVIPKAADIGLPAWLIEAVVKKPNGLILVTGPTGSGKSTTLATMIDEINATRSSHIITIEDPIEYLHVSKRSLVSQREIGCDTGDFKQALKYILRQNPDVVLIGEMRDWETIQSAITVAETGHLVFATLHTNNTVQTIDRIIDVFPASQQEQIRTQLSFIVEAVISQQLLKKTSGGRVPALEILLPTSAIRNLIREGKTHQIYAQMQMGQTGTGMQTMPQALADLTARGIVARDEALLYSANHQEFSAWLERYRKS